MIDDLLDFARSNGSLRVRPVSLAQTAAAVQDDLDPAIAAAGAHIDVQDFIGEADPSQLHTLLQNLLQNSLNYRHPHRGVRITIRAAGVADSWYLEFADTGIGISPENRQRALEPLVRLESKVAGTGLGLATCNRIAQAHGGHLQLSETDGGGLTVRVWFGGGNTLDQSRLL